jgi:hypothetical protein
MSGAAEETNAGDGGEVATEAGEWGETAAGAGERGGAAARAGECGGVAAVAAGGLIMAVLGVWVDGMGAVYWDGNLVGWAI